MVSVDEIKCEEGVFFIVFVGSSIFGKVGFYDVVIVDLIFMVNEI